MRTRWSAGTLATACGVLIASLAGIARGDDAEPAEFPAADLEFVETKVRPLLAEHCFECHSGRLEQPKGGLRLDQRSAALRGGESGPAVTPRKPDESLLVAAVRWKSFEMPPKGKLKDSEIATLVKWIELGAPWPREGAPTPGTSKPGEYDWVKWRGEHWSFQPASYSGTYVNIHDMQPDRVLRDLKNQHLPRNEQRRQADLLAQLNRLHLAQQPRDEQLESSIQTMELAFRMQFAVPDALDLSRETAETLRMYGDSEYAKGCLLARRLIERGVRCVQLSHSIDGYDIAWDTGHDDIAGGHKRLADACDQGIAALLCDLKRRGLLDETLVLWGGEFGRAPTSEGQKGRDHDHYGFTVWMAGGGVRGGMSYGATDEFGLSAVEQRVHVHDLHATILHLMGLDHQQLTYRYSGRDFRLTDVHGQVIRDILA